MIKQMVSSVSEGAYVILFNDRGHVKAHIKPEYIDNRTIFYLTGQDGNRIRSIMKRLDEAKNKSIISEFIDYEGKSHMGSFSLINLRSTSWYILVLMDVNALLYSIFVPFILLLVISLMLILGSLLILINRIVLLPLGVIDSSLAKIMNKDFNVKIDLATGDEFTLVAKTVNMMTANIKEYTEHLEEMVAQRTKELQQAFEEVNALKVQQDGDYFLTSLLIDPLLIKEVDTNVLDIDFHISQKKKFTFKKRHGEIGGDVCIAREVVLMDKRYIAFANGDAMGKSLQGAGGALVMGVVFNAFVNRTPIFGAGKMPEAWLMEIYEELNRVFVSFDGSMLISVVIGLIDEETGALYYFNAEHPWTVLYRGGVATFTEDELTLRKLGTVGFENRVLVRMQQLEQGDVIYLGSDGRDDVLLGYDEETGQRIINEDETMFLRCIEQAEGKLEGVVKAVEESGELTDDFTLIRIEWKKPPHVIPPDYEAVRSSAFKALADKDTSRALQLLRKAMYLHPDIEVVDRLANILHEAGETVEEMRVYQYALKIVPLNEGFLLGIVSAARRIAKDIYDGSRGKEEFKYHIRLTVEYGERLLLLNPNHLKCLIIVADCYRLFKRYADAEALLERARRISGDDEMLKIVEKMVERDKASLEQDKGKKA
jgi:tetratricopeptide (TPR) repeat protein